MTDQQEIPEGVRTSLKSVIKEAVEEYITEQKDKEEKEDPPKRTEKPQQSVWSSLFGG